VFVGDDLDARQAGSGLQHWPPGQDIRPGHAVSPFSGVNAWTPWRP
jgi:hypothetical protein